MSFGAVRGKEQGTVHGIPMTDRLVTPQDICGHRSKEVDRVLRDAELGSEVHLQSGLEKVQIARMRPVLHVRPTLVGLQADVLAPIPAKPRHQNDHSPAMNRTVT